MSKLQDIDKKIRNLVRSTQYFKDEIAQFTRRDNSEDKTALITEYEEYIKNNNQILKRFKDQSFRIVSAFVKAGANLEKDIYPLMKHKALYMP